VCGGGVTVSLFVHVCVCVCVRACTSVYVCVHACIYVCTYMHVCVHIQVCVCVQAYMYVRTCVLGLQWCTYLYYVQYNVQYVNSVRTSFALYTIRPTLESIMRIARLAICSVQYVSERKTAFVCLSVSWICFRITDHKYIAPVSKCEIHRVDNSAVMWPTCGLRGQDSRHSRRFQHTWSISANNSLGHHLLHCHRQN
jgi:hypothetical protein